jgi:hypothetical protein
MAKQKLSELPLASGLTLTDLLYVVQSTASKATNVATLISFLDTSKIRESGNLYYTNARVYANVAALINAKANVTDLTTANVSENPSHLYYTNARVYANIFPIIDNLTTTDIVEDSQLYFTETRARQAISVVGDGSYDVSTGVITIDAQADVSNITTANVAEVGNLYYTNQRAYSNTVALLANTTTANISEHSSNLYFTNARVYANVIGLIPNIAGLAKTTDLNTSNVVEGSNLYFTNARVVSALTAGNNIVIASNGLITSTAAGGGGNLDFGSIVSPAGFSLDLGSII